jgi:orotate phosphoribosyltransferase
MGSLRSADKLALRVRAFNLIRERSYREGDFTLASGRKSKFYLDMKPTMLHPEGAHTLSQLVLDKIKDWKVDAVGGLAMGAVPLVTAVSLASSGTARPLPAFVVRKEVKDHGTMLKVETAIDLKGKNVAILEDVTTSGESADIAVNRAREAGANVALVLSIVDRGEGAVDFYKKRNIPFEWLFRLSEFQSGTASA